MIFKIEQITDDLVQTAYEEGLKELNEFWGIDWIRNTPNICVVNSREEIDGLKGIKSKDYVVGWGGGQQLLYILNFKKMKTESSHKNMNEIGYKALVKHELNHIFMAVMCGRIYPLGPKWLNEGLCIFISGQLKLGQWKRPEKFVGFIESNNDNPSCGYSEGGFVVELLVNKFGKEKIIQLVKALPDIEPGKFGEKFKDVYGFELTYEEINTLYLEK